MYSCKTDQLSANKETKPLIVSYLEVKKKKSPSPAFWLQGLPFVRLECFPRATSLPQESQRVEFISKDYVNHFATLPPAATADATPDC